MFFIFSKVLAFGLNPLLWVCAIWIYSFFAKMPRRRRIARVSSLALLLLASNALLAERLRLLWEVDPVSYGELGDYDVAIVLGGGMAYYNKELERIVYTEQVDRLMQAAEVYRRGKVKKILVSGGSGHLFRDEEEVPEADLARTFLQRIGVPGEDILSENQSRNTRENAAFSARLLTGAAGAGENAGGEALAGGDENGPTQTTDGSGGRADAAGPAAAGAPPRVLLFTSALHMRRALGCFEHAGLPAAAFTTNNSSGAFSLEKLLFPDVGSIYSNRKLLHEMIGCIAYWLAGYI